MHPQSVILIVDDDPVGRSATAALLAREAYDVATADDGPAALELAVRLKPDVILLDVMMPGMDGFEVTRRLRAQPETAEVPILLLTALDDPDSRLTGIDAGADDFLSKPIDRVELRARLRTITRLNRFRRLQEQREQYRLLFDRSPCGLLVLDRDGRVSEANPTATRLLEKWLTDKPYELQRLVPADQVSRLQAMFTMAAADPGTTAHEEFATPLGQERATFELSVCRLSADDGTLLAALTDRTAERLLEQELRLSQKMESVGRLAGGIAHDFNNLLTVINGFSELALARMEVEHPSRGDIEQILRAGERAAILTRQILAFTRRTSVAPVHLDLGHLVLDLEKMIQRLLGENVRVQVQSRPTTGVVWADPGHLEQILINLAVNARDAMPGGGVLSIETQEIVEPPAALGGLDRRWLRLTVEDNGCGMTPAVMARIFEPFFTTKEIGKGTGLGLATVYGIVQQCDGRIQVDSVPGRGTRFHIDFPRRDPVVEPAGSPEHATVPRGMETILLAEDNDAVRHYAETALTSAGYTVISAVDGADALSQSAARSGPVQLLVTDLVMPRLGGRELFQRLRESRPQVKVLLMSGYDESSIGGQHDPAEVFLQKPYTPLQLLRAVREVLDR